MKRRAACGVAAAVAALSLSTIARAEDEEFGARGAATAIAQGVPKYPSSYSGPNSFGSNGESPTSIAAELFLGAKPWTGAEAFVVLEFEGRNELRAPHGIAAYPNAQRFHTPDPASLLDTAPVFLRQTIALGGPRLEFEGERERLKATKARDRIEVLAGRFGLGETFDHSRFAHDSGTQFLNAALLNGAAFDYAGDALGYTWGALGLITDGTWTARAAATLVPKSPGSLAFDPRIDRANAETVEAETRFHFGQRAGAIRMTGYRNSAPMGLYEDARGPGATIVAARREGRVKTGLASSADQEVTHDIGIFLRWSIGDGRKESWSELEVDQGFAGGGRIGGALWGRASDEIGIGTAASLLAPAHRRYLESGGIGKTLGDGGLSYRAEIASEAYYRLGFLTYGSVSADYQLIVNPGYNAARGPLSVFGLRLHGEI